MDYAKAVVRRRILKTRSEEDQWAHAHLTADVVRAG
jgi:hypothetical protein